MTPPREWIAAQPAGAGRWEITLSCLHKITRQQPRRTRNAGPPVRPNQRFLCPECPPDAIPYRSISSREIHSALSRCPKPGCGPSCRCEIAFND